MRFIGFIPESQVVVLFVCCLLPPHHTCLSLSLWPACLADLLIHLEHLLNLALVTRGLVRLSHRLCCHTPESGLIVSSSSLAHARTRAHARHVLGAV